MKNIIFILILNACLQHPSQINFSSELEIEIKDHQIPLTEGNTCAQELIITNHSDESFYLSANLTYGTYPDTFKAVNAQIEYFDTELGDYIELQNVADVDYFLLSDEYTRADLSKRDTIQVNPCILMGYPLSGVYRVMLWIKIWDSNNSYQFIECPSYEVRVD